MKTCTIRHLRENWKSRQDEMNERIVDDNYEGSNHLYIETPFCFLLPMYAPSSSFSSLVTSTSCHHLVVNTSLSKAPHVNTVPSLMLITPTATERSPTNHKHTTQPCTSFMQPYCMQPRTHEIAAPSSTRQHHSFRVAHPA